MSTLTYVHATSTTLMARQAKPPTRATSDPRRALNFTTTGKPRLSASSGRIERPVTPPKKGTKP
jgi:hypothetical protein